ncbi:hypothetical protein, partial [Acinetobacter baumannii]|uniref:hypothetical protein n=1 Tax=Acinetobacter baumannii TaxID=470 RepID=UPI001C068C33
SSLKSEFASLFFKQNTFGFFATYFSLNIHCEVNICLMKKMRQIFHIKDIAVKKVFGKSQQEVDWNLCIMSKNVFEKNIFKDFYGYCKIYIYT